ncbi:MAG: pyridoxamine 5-phosphate oxidase [Moraxellaceae bacterium]|jgi:pyridoxamine 5'-phosphate oxidase|nr:pyridoxamine 5-phosphate oxidase [Moraxellaceae bacterium]
MTERTDLAAIRQEYSRHSLSPEDCLADPLAQFSRWLDEAIAAKVNEPTAMHVATAGADGRPSGRLVLLKGIEQQRFVFYTNYESRKAGQLEANPFAALTFFWPELERQVRIEGRVERLPAAVSDAYFESRPYQSRIGAWASRQSEALDSTRTLLARAARFAAQYVGGVPRPPHWGGYGVLPDRIEFWQGRPSRMHDRVVFRAEGPGQWRKERLYP